MLSMCVYYIDLSLAIGSEWVRITRSTPINGAAYYAMAKSLVLRSEVEVADLARSNSRMCRRRYRTAVPKNVILGPPPAYRSFRTKLTEQPQRLASHFSSKKRCLQEGACLWLVIFAICDFSFLHSLHSVGLEPADCEWPLDFVVFVMVKVFRMRGSAAKFVVRTTRTSGCTHLFTGWDFG